MTAGPELSKDLVRRARLLSMGVARPQARTVAEAAKILCGIQAQDYNAAALGIRARSKGLTAADVDKAMFRDRTVARTWLMRETIHLVPAADLHWMLSLFGPRNAAASMKRAPGLGLSESDGEKGLKAIRRAAEKTGAATRVEITAALKKAGIDVDPLNRVPMHLVRRAGSLGIIVEVAPKDGSQAFGSLQDWIPATEELDRQTALERLARGYFAAFQPASRTDFAAWSGLPVGELNAGIERLKSELAEVSIGGSKGWVLERDLPRLKKARAVALRLLPAFDGLILGYKSREFAIDRKHLKAIWPGGGVIRPVVTVDGRAIGTWKVVKKAKGPQVAVQAFGERVAPSEKDLSAEIRDVQRFLGG